MQLHALTMYVHLLLEDKVTSVSMYLLDGAVKVHRSCRLCMDTDDVTASLGKVSHPLLRMHNHLHESAGMLEVLLRLW